MSDPKSGVSVVAAKRAADPGQREEAKKARVMTVAGTNSIVPDGPVPCVGARPTCDGMGGVASSAGDEVGAVGAVGAADTANHTASSAVVDQGSGSEPNRAASTGAVPVSATAPAAMAAPSNVPVADIPPAAAAQSGPAQSGRGVLPGDTGHVAEPDTREATHEPQTVGSEGQPPVPGSSSSGSAHYGSENCTPAATVKTSSIAQPSSLPTLEKVVVKAMLREVDQILKKEIAFLRDSETRFGTQAQNGRPIGARKRRADGVSGRGPNQVAPLDFTGGGNPGTEFRSPRTPKPNQRWSREDAAAVGVHPVMKPFQKLLATCARLSPAPS
eukprot:COSAG01_NODE_2961_length_6792_cov_3.056178_6_plen_329_part_00